MMLKKIHDFEWIWILRKVEPYQKESFSGSMLSFKGCIHISGTSPWICWISLPSCDPFSRRAFGFGGPKGVLGGCCRQWWAAVFVLGCYPEDSWDFHRTTNEKTTSTLVKNDWMLFQGLKIHVVDILLKVYLYLVGFN